MAQREVVHGVPGAPSESVARGTPAALRAQRARLLAAAENVAAERGFAGTRVADLVAAAGVSRNTFYRHFRNTEECLLAAVAATADEAERAVLTAFVAAHESTPEERFGAAFGALTAQAARYPAAFRLWIVEAFGVGPAAEEQVDRLRTLLERLVARTLNSRRDERPMPPEIVRAIAGGLYLVVHSRLRVDRAADLSDLAPDLTAWALGYRTPARALVATRAAAVDPATVRKPATDARSRMLRAVAETVAAKGYAGMTISDVAQRANVSLSTFYAHFAGREEAFVAVVEDHERWLLDKTLDAYQSAPDWPRAVGTGLHRFFALLAADPQMAYVDGLAVYSGGPGPLSLRQTFIASYEALLAEGHKLNPWTPAIASEAIGACVAATMHRYARAGRTHQLHEAAPVAAFLALAPFVSTAQATAIAVGDVC